MSFPFSTRNLAWEALEDSSSSKSVLRVSVEAPSDQFQSTKHLRPTLVDPKSSLARLWVEVLTDASLRKGGFARCLSHPTIHLSVVSFSLSNKIVPQVYRRIIDDVIEKVKVDFDEYGIEEDVLINLQAKWEAKLLETRVADFARAPDDSSDQDEDETSRTPLKPSTSASGSGNAAAGPSGRPNQGNPAYGYYSVPPQSLALPSNGIRQGGPNSTLSLPNGRAYGPTDVQVKPEPEDVLRVRGGAPPDTEVKEEDAKVELKPEPNAAGLLPGDDIIGSDLDDSDDELGGGEDDDEEGGDADIVFCVYDKVQRVKNKWKTVFKDGMIHVNGRDYLFAKCNGEFEW